MRFQLSIRNFKAFGETPVSVDFTRPGVTLIQGRNLSSKSKNSNGTGKSTLLEALLVALYGLLPEVPKAALVNSETGCNCELVATVTDDRENTAVITRRIGFKKTKEVEDGVTLVVNGVDKSGNERVTQERINDFIGLDRETFLMSVLFTMSDSRSFAGETPSKQDAVFTKILHLEDLTTAQAKTKAELMDLSHRHLVAQNSITSDEARIGEIDAQIEAQSKAREQWQLRVDARRLEIAKGIETLNASLAKLQDEIEDDEALVEAKEVEYLAAKEAAEGVSTEALTVQIEALRREQGPLDQHYAVLGSQVSTLSSEQKQAQGLHGKVKCPTCKQNLPPDYVEGQILAMQSTKEGIQQEMQGLETERTALAARMTALAQDLRSAQDQQNRWSRLYTDWQMASNALKLKLSKKESLVAQVHQRSEELQNIGAELPPEVDTSNLEARLSDLRTHQVETQATITNDLLPAIEVCRFWETGFGQTGLRNLMVESLLPELNRIATRYAETLTNGELVVTFSAQKKLAGGETRNKLCVEVTDLYGSDSYETSSGGERRRIDFIVNLALYSLISSRTHIPFVVFDEAFVKMDEAGIRFMLLLLDELKGNIPSVFIVSNQDYVSSEVFDTRWTVERSGRTSTLKVS
jgi:DNA repair exonuclease SbcCD ATPase subunit